tara:strand:+ start:240 stop:746 length:507 start_codon:yes stop_codon:yes gene_type:complete
MKTYYTLIGVSTTNPRRHEDCEYEIIFGDYDREVVEDEKDDSHDYRRLKIITTGDGQADIWKRVYQENAKLTDLNKVDVDQLANVAQGYLVIWFRDGSVEVFNRNYTLISTDIEVAGLVVQYKNPFEYSFEEDYPSPATGRTGDARWYESDPDIIDPRLNPLTSNTER